VTLTSSSLAFCEWFGLDYSSWKRQIFDKPMDLWIWLTTVPAGSIAAEAWKRLARRAEVPTKKLKSPGSKLTDVVAFVEWLRQSSPFAIDRSLWVSWTKEYPVSEELTPDSPAPVKPIAVQALNRWGKMDEHDALLKQRIEEAKVLAHNQGKKNKRQASNGGDVM
jgi:hypothetical protein